MRFFSARETEWLQELDGIELASFRRRAIAFTVDSAISGLTVALITGATSGLLHRVAAAAHSVAPVNVKIVLGHSLEEGSHFFRDIVVPILYFGLLTWRGKGRSPGKYWMKIRVVSLVHRHFTLWHSVERALGYGAAFLEGGFGFFQFFIHPYRRTVQDRIAETIVVTEASYLAMQHKLTHPLLPDDGHQSEARLSDELPPPPPPIALESQAGSSTSSM